MTLLCSSEDKTLPHVAWYKQEPGEAPQLLSYRLNNDVNSSLEGKFKDNPRFTVEDGEGINHLKISDVRPSDSGTYYCGRSYYILQFITAVTLQVNGSESEEEMNAQPPMSESVHHGDSVSLSCKVQTQICDGNQTVFWFRQRGESHLQIL